jgi:DNA-binding CsgD family transcriptional regulator
VDRARAVENPWAEIRALGALGFLELTVGDPAAAVAALAPARATLDRMGLLEPGWYRVDGDLAEALVMVGRLDEAEDAVAAFEGRAAGGRHPWSLVVSARARGLLEAARGDDDAAIRSLEGSLATDGSDHMAVERARTLLALGATLRRANRRRSARAALGESIAALAAAGCAPWAERARVELAGVSGRVASPTELSGMERRVAELAVAGRTNREIADELFLSVRTVESHLSSTYRKLDVRSRTELGAALADRRQAG